MSTETTKKKIKIDNGTNYAYAYTDKAIDAKMPTDINVDANGFAILEHDGTEITGQRKTVRLADVRENGAIIGRDQTTSAPQIDELITKAYADKEYGAPISVESNAEDLPVTITLTDEQSTAIENQIANGHFNVNVTLSATGQKFLFNQAVTLAEGGVLYYAMAMISFSLFTAVTIVMTYSKSAKTLTLSQQEPLFKNETSLRVIDNKVSLYSGDNDVGAPFGKSYSVAKINGNSILNDPDTIPVPPSYYAPETINTTATSKVLTSKSGAFEWSDLPSGGASVSPTLNLLTEDLSAVRSSITEEEKNNLEKGLYNSVLFMDFSLGEGAMPGILFPQRLVGLGGDFMFSSYKAKTGTSEADDWSFLGASTYSLSIGEKASDGNYPITINKMNDVKGIQTINAVLTVDQATQDITIQLDVTPSGDMFILSPTQSEESGFGNVLMVRQPDGNYSGFWSISDDTVVCYVKPDGTGFAFYAPTTFLFHSTRETDGKVLTIESGVPRWLDPVSSLPAITSADVGKFLTVKSDQKTAWGSVPQGSPIEIVLDESKPYFNVGEYNGKIGVFVLSRPNNAILYEAKFDDSSVTFTEILLYGSMKADAQNVDYLNVSGSLYGLNGDSTLAYIGSGTWQLKSEDNYKFLPYPYFQEASLCCSGGISGAIPSFTLYGSAIGKTSPDYIGLLPQVCKYCALRYDFKKTSSTTDTEKVTSAFFGSVSADNILTPTKITLIGIFDNGMGKAVLEKNASGVFESKTPIEYVEDVNAITYSKARYEHTIAIKNSEGKILWTQTMRNSKDTVVNSYTNLKTLFGEATYAGFGEYCQLNLHGGTEETDKLIKADGTEVTLASLGAIVYTDDCFLPK